MDNMNRARANPEDEEVLSALHAAVVEGKLKDVETAFRAEDLHKRDRNWWQPIHEAVRSGEIDVVRFLVDKGADIHSKTLNGGSVLWWARKVLSPDHPIISYLSDLNATDEGPFQSEF